MIEKKSSSNRNDVLNQLFVNKERLGLEVAIEAYEILRINEADCTPILPF
jgi:hypothetical protein